jgi:hypothetical protein
LPLPEDPTAWFDVQRQTLGRIHPSWLPGIPAELVEYARGLSLGRRWLANSLGEASPTLFGLPVDLGPESVADLRAATWLGPLLNEPMECALDLGSLAMSSVVRTLVHRSAVMRLRTALGAERYARVLASPATAAEPVSVGEDDGDVVDRLVRRGAGELAAFAATLHPAWGESVRLTFDKSWWLGMPPPSLAPAAAEACLRARRSAAKAGTITVTTYTGAMR